MTKRTLTSALLSVGLATSIATPAFADGAASTRNILLGGAAAAAGTLLIINHNKQVHQRYADDARRQADAQAQASNAQAAYAAERRAYDNEVALNAEYKHEVATQHTMIESLRKNVAQARSAARATQTAARAGAPVAAPPRTAVAKVAQPAAAPVRLAANSWGWGQL